MKQHRFRQQRHWLLAGVIEKLWKTEVCCILERHPHKSIDSCSSCLQSFVVINFCPPFTVNQWFFSSYANESCGYQSAELHSHIFNGYLKKIYKLQNEEIFICRCTASAFMKTLRSTQTRKSVTCMSVFDLKGQRTHWRTLLVQICYKR